MFRKTSGRLVNFRPIAIICLVSILSIFLSIFSYSNPLFLIIPELLFVLAIIFLLLFKRTTKVVNFLIFILIVFSIFSFRTLFIINQKDKTLIDGEVEVVMRAKVEEISQIQTGNYAVILAVENGEEIPKGSRVLVFLTDEYHRGDTLSILANFKPIEKDYDNLKTFVDRVSYRSSSYVKVVEVKKYDDFFNNTYYGIREIIINNTTPNSASILLGLLVGDKSFIEKQTLDSFTNAGIGHIFAVSGLHIGFLAVFVLFILEKIGIRPYGRCILVSIILLLYCGICGWSLSSIRALIMATVLSLSNATGKKYDILNSLLISVILILFIMPESVFDYGFLLSVSAVGGIALYSSQINRALSKNVYEKLSRPLSVSVSAYLGTLPIVLRLSSSASIITILINVLVLPLISAVFYFSLVAVILVACFSNLSFLVGFVGNLVELIVNVILLVDYDSLLFYNYPTAAGICFYYLNFLLFSDKINLKNSIKFVMACFIFCLVVLFI